MPLALIVLTPIVWVIIAIILLAALFGGGWGYRSYGYAPAAAFSPFALLIVVLIILILAGVL